MKELSWCFLHWVRGWAGGVDQVAGGEQLPLRGDLGGGVGHGGQRSGL